MQSDQPFIVCCLHRDGKVPVVSKVKFHFYCRLCLMLRLHLPWATYNLFVYDFLYSFSGIVVISLTGFNNALQGALCDNLVEAVQLSQEPMVIVRFFVSK